MKTTHIMHHFMHKLPLVAALFILQTSLLAQTNVTDAAGLAAVNGSGTYVIKNDIDASSFTTSIASFSGTLEADINPTTKMPFRIKNLGVPLFTSLTGTVRNVVIESVSITTSSGNTGAIACNASGSARIYNVGILGGSVEGTAYTGGLVGLLDGEARVVNCYSYADITDGTYVGGLVGYNNVATASDNLKTMVFACMFYGDITGGSTISPVYGGTTISNTGTSATSGVSNFNYFRLEAPYVQPTGVTYNCALGAEDRYLKRFEFYRHILNGQRKLAGWWATGTYSGSDMLKWVLLPDSIGTDHPYPVLMQQGKYPSVVNLDAANALVGKPRNQGGKLGTLTVNIQMGDGAVYQRPSGAAISTNQLTLNITDKDTAHFNFNYYKVQLPYYNEVGTKNYNGNRVVTGWKIVSITGGTPGTFTASDTWGGYNFADRHCTNKDLFSVSGRIFNQGAYWDVPEGVTAITIEPYWARCVYLADPNADKIYKSDMSAGYDVANVGGGVKYSNGNSYSIAGENQVVYTTIGNAIASAALYNGVSESARNNQSVYDYAVVLVGNYHHYYATNKTEASKSKPYTITSIDLDGDNEPDYSYILRFDGRSECHPVRTDFINMPGLGMAQKSTGGTGSYNFGILIPKGWFESTNTSLLRFTQFEYEHKDRSATDAIIVQGGVMEQWVSNNQKGTSNKIPYIHVGGNVWFKEFHTGCHQDKQIATKHSPVSVTGGDYDEFYLTGLYRGDFNNKEDNAECYINGGRFGTVCGAAMEGIGKANGADNTGNISWLIQNADIREFYAGGLNAAKPVTGNLSTTIIDSYVDIFCGGPKFGDMSANKTVVTDATGCTFGTFFGAGYGGNSYNRYAPTNQNNVTNINWNNWVGTEYTRTYNSTYGGVSTRFLYQFLPMSDNKTNVARILVDFVKFSLATCRNVTSTLTGCTITGNYYGGGSLGMVAGPVASTLTNCTVNGNVYGAGYSAALPTVEVDGIGFQVEPLYYTDLGTYRTGVKGPTTTYTWAHGDAISINTTDHILYTTEDLNGLGKVLGNVNLTITGSSSHIYGDVYGGGAISDANTDANNTTTVNILDGTFDGNIYGGGQGDLASLGTGHSNVAAKVNGEVIVNIGKIEGGLGGNATFGSESSVFGCNNINGSPQADVTVNIYQTARTAKEEASYTSGDAAYAIPNVFGGGNKADYLPADVDNRAKVHIHNCYNTVENVYGGGNAAAAQGVVTVIDGGRFNQVFGGGNGYSATGNHSDPSAANYNPGADIGAGGISLTVHGGTINQLFGGSNQYGDINGPTVVTIDNEGGCTENITEFFGGGNEAVIGTELAPIDISTTISCGTGQIGTIYGGSNKADIHGDVELNIMGGGPYTYVYGGSKGIAGVTEAKIYGDVTLNIYGGTITNAFGGADANGNIYGNIQVNVDWSQSSCADAKSIGYVYGGGNLAPYQPTVTNPVSLTPEVNIIHGTVTNNVFGGGLGAAAVVTANPTVTIGDVTAGHEDYVANVGGNVYGGGEEAGVTGSTNVTVQQSNTVVTGSVYGGGKGLNNNYLAAPVTGGTSVEMTGGWVKEDIYGGGEMASVGTFTRNGSGVVTAVTSGGTTNVSVSGGRVGHSSSTGNVFGGGYGVLDDAAYAYVASTDVDINGTAHVYRHVYGGGNLASVDGNTTVAIGNAAGTATPTVDANVFGGSALGAIGNATGTTTVNILAGTVSGDVFGGGNGDAGTGNDNDNRAADVRNEVVVNIGNATQGAGAGNNVVITGFVFGANNIMGSPKKNTLVNIYCTGHSGTNVFPSGIASLVDDGAAGTADDILTQEDLEANQLTQTYALTAVYGGGNKAAHVPTSSSDSARVYVYYCDKNTIENVYGGGNAANTQNNRVVIMGGRIKNVFGGGNGDGLGNPGANVLGTATTLIHGGVIDNVFGGSNKLGDIGTTDLQTDDNSSCPLYLVGNVFGGGNESIGGGGTITLKCGTKFHNFYGGANKANIGSLTDWNNDIKHNVELIVEGGVYDNVFGGNNTSGIIYGDVTVTVKGGSIDNLFGGNNLGGNIMGTITVNVNLDEEHTCPSEPLKLTNVYGGGNMALYEPADATSVTPVVNIIHTANSTGTKDFNLQNVYGGGLGNGTSTYTGVTPALNYSQLTGYVHSNPYVNVGTGTSGKQALVYGNVFGGGQAAPVEGSTTVKLNGNDGQTVTIGTIDDAPETAPRMPTGKGDIFGGGLGTTASVSGNTSVGIFGNRTTVYHNVYGGGSAGVVQGSTDVQIATDAEFSIMKPEITIAADGTTTITSKTPGVTFRYTTNGDTPTAESGNVYSGSFNVLAGQTVKAIAYRSGYTTSAVATATCPAAP